MSVSNVKGRFAAAVGFAALSLAVTAVIATGFVRATGQDPSQRYAQAARSFAQHAAANVRVVAAPAPAATRTVS
jgi:hypothetical protein